MPAFENKSSDLFSTIGSDKRDFFLGGRGQDAKKSSSDLQLSVLTFAIQNLIKDT